MKVRTLILVIGCHRSGTSAVTGALGKMGVELGHNLMPPAPDNPRGFFEDLAAVAAHDGLLASIGASWDRPPHPGATYPPGARVKARAQIRAIVRRLPGPVCAVKDPRATFFVGLWREACTTEGVRLCVLEVERAQSAVAASLMKRNGWPESRGRELRAQYAQAAERAAGRVAVPWAVISFPWQLWEVDAWRQIAQRFAIDLNCGMPAVRGFVEKELVHHG